MDRSQQSIRNLICAFMRQRRQLLMWANILSPRWRIADVHIIRLLSHTLYIMVMNTQHGQNVDDCMIFSLSRQTINIDIASDALRQVLHTHMVLPCPQSDSGQVVHRGQVTCTHRSHAHTHLNTCHPKRGIGVTPSGDGDKCVVGDWGIPTTRRCFVAFRNLGCNLITPCSCYCKFLHL